MWQRDEVTGKRINNVYFAGSLLAEISRPIGATTATITYLHTDALGSPIAKSNASQGVIETSEYEPYGKLLNRANDNRAGYTGHVMDGVSGLTYMQQRYYDPGIGRFLSVDPVGVSPINGLNFNRYWYASNNPYKNTDPDGRCDGPSTCAIDRDIAAMNRGDMSRQEFMDRSEARAAGAAIGAGAVAVGVGAVKGVVWLTTTPAGRATILAALRLISRTSDDEAHKLGRRVEREQIQQVRKAREDTVREARQRDNSKPQGPPKSPEPTKPGETPKPPKPPEPPEKL